MNINQLFPLLSPLALHLFPHPQPTPLCVIAFFQLIFSLHCIIPPGIFSFLRFRYSRDEDHTQGGGPEGVSDF